RNQSAIAGQGETDIPAQAQAVRDHGTVARISQDYSRFRYSCAVLFLVFSWFLPNSIKAFLLVLTQLDHYFLHVKEAVAIVGEGKIRIKTSCPIATAF
nr:hypothetical protein [Victivallaceae bacterium]